MPAGTPETSCSPVVREAPTPGCSRHAPPTSKGAVVGFRPALERLAVRQISARYLTEGGSRPPTCTGRDEYPADRPASGRAPATIPRELFRNARATDPQPTIRGAPAGTGAISAHFAEFYDASN